MYSRPNKQRKQTSFEQCYQQGYQMLQQRNHSEASKLFKRAKKLFNPKQDSYSRLIDLILNEARIETQKKDYETALELLQNNEKEMQRQYRSASKESYLFLERLEFKVKLISQKCQVYIAEAQNSENDQLLQRNINKCIDSFVQIIIIIAKVLSDDDLSSRLDSQMLEEWQQLYLEITISSIDPLLVEFNKAQDGDPAILKIIYKIAEKVDNFYKLSNKTEPMKKCRAKSWYYRAAMLLKTSKKFEKIEQFLRRDYDYCLKNNLAEDLAKTKDQYKKYFFFRERIQDALNLFDQKSRGSAKKLVQSHVKTVERLQSQIKSGQFFELSREKQKQKLSDYFSTVGDENYEWWPRYIAVVRQVLLRINNSDMKSYICLHLAKAYFEIYDQVNAADYCERSLTQCSQNTQLHYQALKLYNQILEQSNEKKANKKQYEQKLRSVAQRMGKQKQLANQSQERKRKMQRSNMLNQKLLNIIPQLQMLQKLKKQKQEQQLYNTTEIEIQQQKNNKVKNTGISFMRSSTQQQQQQQRKYSQIMEQKYRQSCKQKSIKVRNSIVQVMRKMGNSDKSIQIQFQQYFELTVEELEIILGFVANIEWDFRNFAVNNTLLEKLTDLSILAKAEVFKICNLSKSVSHDVLLTTLKKMPLLHELHLEKLQRKFLTPQNNLIFSFLKQPLQNLKILKLKNCRISDKNLQFFKQYTPQLTQLDLSGNEIEGQQLSQINQLKKVEKLNLSYNPLRSCQKLSNQSMYKLKLKSIRNFNKENRFMIEQAKFLKILDLSENCQMFLEHVLRNIGELFVSQGLFNIPNFKELRIKRCNISQQTFSNINSLFTFYPNIQHLTLSFSHYSTDQLQNFRKYQKKCSKEFEIEQQARASHPYDININ